jgi:hypothetical protein
MCFCLLLEPLAFSLSECGKLPLAPEGFDVVGEGDVEGCDFDWKGGDFVQLRFEPQWSGVDHLFLVSLLATSLVLQPENEFCERNIVEKNVVNCVEQCRGSLAP